MQSAKQQIEKECKKCLHKIHKSECKLIVGYDKKLQREIGKKRGICGCPSSF